MGEGEQGATCGDSSACAAASGFLPDRLRALVVDDEPTVARLVAEMLQHCHGLRIEATVAADYQQAHELLLSGTFDLALVDYHLWEGGATGLDLIKAAQVACLSLPIILLTGSDREDLDLQALKIGADDFLEKTRLQLGELCRTVRFALYRHQNKQLADKLSHLQRARQSMGGILSALSHEIRNHLGGILLQARAGRQVEPERQGAALAQIEHAATDLLLTAENILDATRFDHQVQHLQVQEVVLADEVADAIEILQPLASEHGVVVSSAGAGAAGTLLADGRLLRRLLLNLLSNAIRYGEGADVRLQLWRDGDGVLQLLVRDDGPGIEPGLLAQLGQPFALHSGCMGNDHIAGFGLGLYVCRIVAARFGGSLHLNTEAGVGTSVRVVLPAWLDEDTLQPAPLDCALGGLEGEPHIDRVLP